MLSHREPHTHTKASNTRQCACFMRRSLHQKLGTLLLSAPSFGAVVPHPSCLASCTIGRRPRHQQGWLAPPAPAAAAVDAGSKRDAPAAAVSPAAAAASAAFHTSSIRSCKHSSSRASTQVSCTGSTSGQPSAAADTQPQVSFHKLGVRSCLATLPLLTVEAACPYWLCCCA